MARDLSSAFKIAFFALLGLTVIFVVLALVMSAGIAHPTESQSSAEAWLFGAASSTLTGMMGLFGGKVA
jgi:hypothetical protein